MLRSAPPPPPPQRDLSCFRGRKWRVLLCSNAPISIDGITFHRRNEIHASHLDLDDDQAPSHCSTGRSKRFFGSAFVRRLTQESAIDANVANGGWPAEKLPICPVTSRRDEIKFPRASRASLGGKHAESAYAVLVFRDLETIVLEEMETRIKREPDTRRAIRKDRIKPSHEQSLRLISSEGRASERASEREIERGRGIRKVRTN